MFDDLNCTTAPPDAATDPGVAGGGVLLSFIITAGLALVLSAVIVFAEFTRKAELRTVRRLLLSFSDQQIVTGIGVQSVALAKMADMVPYHFFIVWMLSVLSTVTHIGSLLVLVNDFKRDWVLRWLRHFLMFVNLLLSGVCGAFVLMAVTKDVPQTLPIACAWKLDAPPSAPQNAGLSVAGTVAVIVGNCVLFGAGVWYLHLKSHRSAKLLMILQSTGLLLLSAFGIATAVRVVLQSQAFGRPPLALRDMGEQEWSFGQLLPLLLLLLPLLSTIEIVRGEMAFPPPISHELSPLDDDKIKHMARLRNSFQPNPFWGQQQNQNNRW